MSNFKIQGGPRHPLPPSSDAHVQTLVLSKEIPSQPRIVHYDFDKEYSSPTEQVSPSLTQIVHTKAYMFNNILVRSWLLGREISLRFSLRKVQNGLSWSFRQCLRS